jgi:hypothetical protein
MFKRSFLAVLMGSQIFGLGPILPADAMLPTSKGRSVDVRSSGTRAHRKWKRCRAAGITPRSRR